MKEFEPVFFCASEPVKVLDEFHTPSELVSGILGHPKYETGWFFPWGDPEFWKFSDKLLVPKGKVLDLGMGFGRSSMFFAMYGMKVTSYETDDNPISYVTAIKNALRLPITIVEDDIRSAELGKEVFDTVLMGQTFTHFPSKNEAYQVMQKAIDALKPGGRLWLRGAGKDDSSFEELNYYSNQYQEVQKIDEDTFAAPCSCSGEWRIDPQLFLEPLEVLHFFAKNGLHIEHTQLIPEEEKANIMYGEDWNRESNPPLRGGRITVIARK